MSTLKPIFCMDIGGTRTKYGLFDAGLETVIATRIEPTETRSLEQFIQAAQQVIPALCQDARYALDEIGAGGIGIPGYVDGDIISMVWPSLAFLEGSAFRPALERALGFPLRMENDARTIAMGEAWYGSTVSKRLLSLTLGTGLGFGMVIDGQLLERSSLNHMAGHIPLRLGTRPCFCGFSGCLESVLSSQAVEDEYERLARAFSPEDEVKRIKAFEVFHLAEQGDHIALQIVQQFLADLQAGLNGYIHLFAPQTIVLGGGLAQALAPWQGRLQQGLFARAYAGYQAQIQLSELKEKAGLYGAASLWAN